MKRFLSFSSLALLFITLALQQTAHAATIMPNILTDPMIGADPTNCSLRYAIESINQSTFEGGCEDHSTGGDLMTDNTIVLQEGDYVLSIPGNDEDKNQTGDLDILAPMVITGPGPLQTSITASGFPADEKDRVIDIAGNFTTGVITNLLPVTLTGVTIRDGNVVGIPDVGGGIRSSATLLTLDNVIVTENFAGQGGGVISGQGALVVLNSQVLNNDAPLSSGGGIYSALTLLVVDSSTVAGNTANGDGGGIFNAGPAVITNSTISGNQALQPPNGASIQGPGIPGLGGGIADLSNEIFLINSTVSGNTATFGGGGIALLGAGGAPATHGAGGPQTIGGIFNVTIARNTVTDQAGVGGGICIDCNTNFTNDINGAGFAFPVTNTLIAENQANEGPDCQGDFHSSFFSDGFNLIGDIGAPDVCIGFVNGFIGDKVGNDGTNPIIDPMITDLLPNGGPTETHGLLQGSMAIDMGDPDGCMAPSIPSDILDLLNNGPGAPAELLRDQRNFIRPIDGDSNGTAICDIGAFEFQVFDFELTKVDDTGGDAVPVGDTFNYIITVTNNGPGDASNVTLSDPIPANVDVISATPSQGACTAIGNVVGCDLGDLAVGESATVTVNVIAVTEGTFTNVVTLTLDNPSQQTLTRTAQVDTTITGNLFVFGSGIHCGLSPVAPSQGALKGLVLLALLSAAGLLSWRRRGQ